MSRLMPVGWPYAEEVGMLNARAVGIGAGVILGVVFVWLGALNAFFVGLFMLAGWLAAKFLSGEIDLLDIYERFMQSRGRSPRR